MAHIVAMATAALLICCQKLLNRPWEETGSCPLLLVNPSDALPPAIAAYLAQVKATVMGGTLFGGPLAVGDDVLGELEATG